jgi:secreted trypsin-like serine protease
MPWMVIVKANYTTLDGHTTIEGGFCTASLVSPRHVLTVAHCAPVSRMPNSSYLITVQFGSANRSAPGGSISVTKANFHVNPQASAFSVNNTAFLSGKISINMHDTALIDVSEEKKQHIYIYIRYFSKKE